MNEIKSKTYNEIKNDKTNKYYRLLGMGIFYIGNSYMSSIYSIESNGNEVCYKDYTVIFPDEVTYQY